MTSVQPTTSTRPTQQLPLFYNSANLPNLEKFEAAMTKYKSAHMNCTATDILKQPLSNALLCLIRNQIINSLSPDQP